MPLADEGVISEGEGCPRGRYRVTVEDLDAISARLDKIDGKNPFVTYNIDIVRREMGGGSKATAGCLAYYLNKRISEDQALVAKGIFVHTDRGNIKFDRNRPSQQEAEPPSA